MIAEKQTKSANFLRIIAILKSLRDDGKISIQEYSRAKKYYKKLTNQLLVFAEKMKMAIKE